MTISCLWGKLRHPQTTARWRLTLLYGGMFLVCGAALLAVTYALVSHQITGGSGIENPPSPARASGGTNTPFIPPLPHSGVNPKLPPPSLTIPPNVPAGIVRVLRSSAGQEFLRLVETQQQVQELNQLEIESAIALGIMTIVSSLLGWVVAGRVLRPVRRITATTQEISETNLHRRLDLAGPRDEFRMLAETIDSLLARLEAAFESQRRFVANASHELRTPLTTMRAALDVSIAKPHLSSDAGGAGCEPAGGPRPSRSPARELPGAGARAAPTAGRGDAGVARARRRTTRSPDSDEAIAAKQIELHSSLAPACVEGSETLLARMVDNLLDNAVRHNLPHGFVNVSCEADRETARLVVESGGSVLDQEAVGQLAQPFRRLGTERTGSQNGHGLGLSIVAAVAAAHGGELTLYAREQGGLGAEITLPVAHAHATTTSA